MSEQHPSHAPSSSAGMRRTMVLGGLLLLLGFGGFLAWAVWAPLDRGVSLGGYLMSEGNRKAVQHLTGGIVDEVLVREGDAVRQGQVVARMNPVSIQANLNASRESTAGLSAQIAGLQGAIQARERQLALLDDQLSGLTRLAEEGFVPRNRVLELQRQRAQLESEMASDRGTLGRSQRQVRELQERQAAYEFDLSNLAVRAPVDGLVQGLAVFTAGAVVPPGFKFFDVVPSNAPLVVEAQVPVNVIDRVHPGLPVELMFTAFNRSSTPVLNGRVLMVSADRVVDEKTGLPYFRLTAQVDADSARLLQGQQLRPGMPVEVFVKTGERTLMNYLMRPLIDRVHGGLRED